MFDAKVRFVLTAALAGTCFSVSLASQTKPADRDSGSTKPQGLIRVFNLARVPKHDFAQAEREVTTIFGGAGIGMAWVDGTLEDTGALITDFSANNSTASGCKVASQAPELLLQLLPHAPKGFAVGILGFSLPCAMFGIVATIYTDRCDKVTDEVPVSFAKVLGYAIAHELGHVLLRSSEHSSAGLMRARWDKAAWLRAEAQGIQFDREHAQRMRLEVVRMASLLRTEETSK
jgi:hypothetical protein